MRTSGRSSFSCMRMTLAMWPLRSRTVSPSPAASLASLAFSTGLSSGFCTAYLMIFRSILMVMMAIPAGSGALSVAPVITVFHGVKQVGGGMDLAGIVDLFVPTHLDHRAVLERELV